MSVEQKFEDEGFPYNIALTVKDFYEDELFKNKTLGILCLEELVDDKNQKTSRFIIGAGVYDHPNRDHKISIFEYAEIPEYLILPNQLLPRILPEYRRNFDLNEKRIRVNVEFTEKFFTTSKVVRPLIGGVSCMHYEYDEAGTLGGKVQLLNEEGFFFISNWHVLVGSNGKLGDKILQPGRMDGGKFSLHQVAEVVWYRLDEYMDVAIAKVHQGVKISGGIKDIEIKDAVAPDVGMNIQKYGRSTQKTKGKILKLNCTVEVFSKEYLPKGSRIFKNQILCDLRSKKGDSGALVVDTDSKNVVGILFAADETNTYSMANLLNFTLPFGNSVEHKSQLSKEPKIESFN